MYKIPQNRLGKQALLYHLGCLCSGGVPWVGCPHSQNSSLSHVLHVEVKVNLNRRCFCSAMHITRQAESMRYCASGGILLGAAAMNATSQEGEGSNEDTKKASGTSFLCAADVS